MSFWARCVVSHCKRFNGIVGARPSIHTLNCSSPVASTGPKDTVFSDLCTMRAVLHNPNELKKFLFERFSQERNCYAYALNLITQTQNKTMSFNEVIQVIQTFKEWLKHNEPSEMLSSELKKKALEAVVHKYKHNYKIFRTICDVYRVREHQEDIKEIIESYITSGNIENAAYVVIALQMQDEYPVEKIAIPLLMSGKFSVCKEYFDGCESSQKEFITLVDNWLGMLSSNPNYKIGGIRGNARAIYKYLTVLMNHGLITESMCPNTSRIQHIGAINVLMRKRQEKSMTDHAWEEMVIPLVQKDVGLQKILIEKLISKEDYNTAMKMSEKFNLPFDASSVPQSQDKEEEFLEEENANDLEPENDILVTKEYLSLDLDPSNIKFIDTEFDFLKCVKHISQAGSVVGIDSEWKPHFRRSALRLSLMQLAVKDQVYILDILALRKCLHKEHWDYFMDEFFANPKVMKLGCGITQDIQMLVDDNLGTMGKAVRFSHILDVSILFQKMAHLYPDSGDSTSNMKGLSKLCEIILGKPLNKEERFCNWELRPLTNLQITYAALDAYCLLQMLDCMKSLAITKGKCFDDLVQSAIFASVSMSKSAVKISKDLKWSRTEKSFSYRFNKGINDFKVVVDSNLTDLGLKLRMYGVDVVICDIADICKDSFKIVNEESRIVIGSHLMSQKVKGLLPEDKYYIVETNSEQKNTVAVVFQHFNIKMSFNAIYSRCMKCNNSELRAVPSDHLRQMWEAYSQSADCGNSDSTEPESHSTSGSKSLLDGIEAEIQLDKLKASYFSSTKTFKVCVKCGHVQFQR